MFSQFLDIVIFTGVVSVGSIYIYKNYGNDIKDYCVNKYDVLSVKEKKGTLTEVEKRILNCINEILKKGPEEDAHH